MHQQVKDKLHYYSRSGLKVECQDTKEIMLLYGLSGIDNDTAEVVALSDNEMCRLMATAKEDDNEYIIPLMRPLSSLTNPITVPGYNDGKPFMPIIELAKMFPPVSEVTHYRDVEIYDAQRGLYAMVKCCLGNSDARYHYFSISIDNIEIEPFPVYELLFRWHFWLWDQQLFETGDIIEIKD